MDKKAGKTVALYRRVGDDIFVADRRPERVFATAAMIQKTMAERGLTLHPEKSYLGPATTRFDYLGYHFSEGHVQISARSTARLVARWQAAFPMIMTKPETKLRSLANRIEAHNYQLERDMITFLGACRFGLNGQQMQALSNQFFTILTKHIWGKNTPRNRAKTRQLTAHMPVPNLFTIFKKLHYEHLPIKRVIAAVGQ